ncbi:hypothetical protein CHARACLAT_030284 [Characodon lateralis]|uniref:Uncharacterized protein n=1 Tax=Characodon lateralis TaxID=208331 RepID=A0ABU7DBX8_9TELE|nr:hypothetical protein [Characodon lateralis]
MTMMAIFHKKTLGVSQLIFHFWTPSAFWIKINPDTTSPSTVATRRPRRSMLGGQEVLDQGRVQHEGGGHPGTVLRTVPLPVDEVLPPTALSTRGQDLAD